MNLRNRSIIMLAAAMLLASCHSTKEVTLPPPSPRTDAAPAMPCEKTVTNFTASVDGISVNGQLRMAHDSVMWISITKIIELGRAVATPDSVWITVPILDKHFAGTYADLSRRVKQQVDFQTLQSIATADNAEELIESLAQGMGYNARVRFISRRKVDKLSFPFAKP